MPGFKHLIQAESASFITTNQTLLNATVTNVAYTDSGVSVNVTTNGGKQARLLYAKYAVVTFSVGVLQERDVTWAPALPHWKQEAIMAMKMATYSKVCAFSVRKNLLLKRDHMVGQIFMKFDTKFWDDSEVSVTCTPAASLIQGLRFDSFALYLIDGSLRRSVQAWLLSSLAITRSSQVFPRIRDVRSNLPLQEKKSSLRLTGSAPLLLHFSDTL